MAAVILAALAVAWLWHAIDLFRPLDVGTLPPRARRRLAGEPPEVEAAPASVDEARGRPGRLLGARGRQVLRVVASGRSR